LVSSASTMDMHLSYLVAQKWLTYTYISKQ
jgi:hypothetical protein